MKSSPFRSGGSSGRAKKINRLAVVVSAAIYIGSTLLVFAALCVWLSWLTAPRPVAALGLIVCGQVRSVTIVMNDGKLQRFDGPGKAAAELIKKVPDKNFGSYSVNLPECSRPKEY